MYLAKIHVTLKPSVLDPQGVAVSNALKNMGYSGVDSLRLGKYMELRLEGQKKDRARVEADVETMCKKLLANVVIERYEFSLELLP
ncbi:MAG: phosphoribosylformylglycinamidine synthase subunit PurS [candidate division FCPU426 bacterium]